MCALAENETRLLSVTVADTPEQTRDVMLAQAHGNRSGRDRTTWRELQTWLADRPTDVVIPFAESLATAIPPVTVRLRRDFSTVLALIAAHALLHQCSRERNPGDAVVATFEDHVVVRGLVADLLADAADRAVSETVRETVAAVAALIGPDPLDEGLTYTRVATHLKISKSSAKRRARTAISRGFIRNLGTRPNLPPRLVLGDPLPEDGSLLPTASDLARLHGCTLGRDEPRTDEVAYPRSTSASADIDVVEPDDWTAEPVGRARVLEPADELTLARIGRARDEAGRTLAKTRDVGSCQATMTRLDAEERVAREPVETRRLTPSEIVDYTRSLPRLWADSGPDGKQALVGAVFAKLDVLGFQRLGYELSLDAIDLGLDAALPPVIELKRQIGEFGRGERARAYGNEVIGTIRVARHPPDHAVVVVA
jgi:hypothetical protein